MLMTQDVMSHITAANGSEFETLADPTFTGTLAAPTINATTALQVNGVNLTQYASRYLLWVIHQ
jgi:hypothetical protein